MKNILGSVRKDQDDGHSVSSGQDTKKIYKVYNSFT